VEAVHAEAAVLVALLVENPSGQAHPCLEVRQQAGLQPGLEQDPVGIVIPALPAGEPLDLPTAIGERVGIFDRDRKIRLQASPP
jgi:hypothetical protein